MRKEKDAPEIINKSEAEIDAVIEAIQKSNLTDGTKEFAIKCIKSAIWFPQFLQRKNISISRLLKIIFGKSKGGSKKKDSTESDSSEKPSKNSDANDLSENERASADTSIKNEDLLPTEPEAKKPGHGRMAHTVYKKSITIPLTIPDLSRGCSCPNGCGGKVYDFRTGIIVRVQGQSIARVVKYTVQKLRCNLCHEIIKAPIPSDVGEEKYDATFKSMVVLQKYYVAVPFYRQEQFQRMLGFPLSDATQWDLVEQVASCAYSVFDVLKKMAGNGRRVFNDDTRVLILEIQKRLNENKGADERRGMFTTGIISEYGEHLIALFLNGTKHAGENLSDLLKFRDPQKDPILQMCDALKHNIPQNFKTIVSHCLSHGFRKFEEMVDYFEEECLTVMKAISDIYAEDEKTKEMTDEERLLHHKKYSRPILAALAVYIKKQFREKRVEPNSELGKAFRYMQKHWKALTLFVRIPGAALDNNIIERALKIAIRNRKSAMFYRTTYSAQIGGMLTSLIYTCHLATVNPQDYLIALQSYRKEILCDPEKWLPWNYEKTRENMQKTTSAAVANLKAQPPPLDRLVAA